MGRAEAERCYATKLRYWTWAALMRRAFHLDVLRGPRCAGRMERIATIDDPAVMRRILAHLGLPGARDGPEPLAAVFPLRGGQPTLPFARPSRCRQPAGHGGRLPGFRFVRRCPVRAPARRWDVTTPTDSGSLARTRRGALSARCQGGVRPGTRRAVPDNRRYVVYALTLCSALSLSIRTVLR